MGPVPLLDEFGSAYFKNALAGAACLLEYGCGGSTVYACEVARVATVISVDSDSAWVDRVRSSLNDTPSNLLISHCDIGETKDWGYPKNNDGFANFWRYMAQPWEVADGHGHQPDVILIDGRFRVACFLFSLLAGPLGATILFDDYFDRPEYFVVEQFCNVIERQGRLGVFRISRGYSAVDLTKRIAQYSVQVR
jgi:hypothetical protein